MIRLLRFGNGKATWLWDTALKFFGRAFSLRHQITWIIRLRINTGKQTDHPSRRTIWIIRVHRRITGDNSSEPIIRLPCMLSKKSRIVPII